MTDQEITISRYRTTIEKVDHAKRKLRELYESLRVLKEEFSVEGRKKDALILHGFGTEITLIMRTLDRVQKKDIVSK